MARCVRCDKKGLMLKLDHEGRCEACAQQEKKAEELEKRAMQEELDTLRAFHETYQAIPDAKAEAERLLEDAHVGAQRALANAAAEADSILAEANAKAEALAQEAERLSDERLTEASDRASAIELSARAREDAAEARAKLLKEEAVGAVVRAKASIDAFLAEAGKSFDGISAKFFDRAK